MSEEQVFLNGLIVKKPRDGAPDFVKGAISIKREELITSISALEGEWINLDIKESKKGEWYAAINHWKAEDSKNDHTQYVSGNRNQPNPTYAQRSQQAAPQQQVSGGDFNDDCPFNKLGNEYLI